MNTTSPPLTPAEAFYLVFLDGLGCAVQMNSAEKEVFLSDTEVFLQSQCAESGCGVTPQLSPSPSPTVIVSDGDLFGIPPFFVKKGSDCVYCPVHTGHCICYVFGLHIWV